MYHNVNYINIQRLDIFQTIVYTSGCSKLIQRLT